VTAGPREVPVRKPVTRENSDDDDDDDDCVDGICYFLVLVI
jgi:hypothetical protein